MHKVTSKDGTTIAFDKSGKGPVVILVNSFLDQAANAQLATLLASQFTVFNYYRRGHGESGDTAPWAVEREFEDLETVIKEAGGSAFVFGSSGNGIFALEMAARGLASKMKKLAVWETPYIVDDSRPPLPKDYQEQLTQLLSENRRGDMIELLFTKGIGMPPEVVAGMRHAPFFPAFEAVAHTLIYDATLMKEAMSGKPLSAKWMEAVTTPTLVIDGGEASWPWLRNGVKALVDVLPNAQRRTLEGQPHNVDVAVLAPVVVEFFN
jgi:pimeloyl-ACP methyl ester carboxylesterase